MVFTQPNAHRTAYYCLILTPFSLCPFQGALRAASRSLSIFLEGKAHLATANIQVPKDWTAADCQTPLEHNKPVRSEVSVT